MPSTPPDRNRWIVTGLAGLSVAAAVIALLFIARPDESTDPEIPATTPTVVASTLPPPDTTVAATTAPVTTSAPTTSTASPTTTSSPTTSTTTSTTTTTTTTTTTPPVAAAAELVVAGPTGVVRDGAIVTDQPMARALPLPDGRTLVQREYNDSNAVQESALLMVTPGTLEPVPLDVPAEFDGVVLRLHDSALIDDEIVAIVETRPPNCPNPTDCLGAIWAFGPDSGRLDQLQEKIVWEGGWTRLSLAETGVAFGAETESVTRTLRSWIVPGTDAVPVDAASVGLEPSYGDCTDCPTGFGIDRTGSLLGWVETDLETFQTTLVVADLRDGANRQIPLVDGGTVCCLDGEGPDLPFIPVVEVDGTTDADLASIRVVVNDEGVLNGGDRRPALVVDVSTGEVTAADGFHVFG